MKGEEEDNKACLRRVPVSSYKRILPQHMRTRVHFSKDVLNARSSVYGDSPFAILTHHGKLNILPDKSLSMVLLRSRGRIECVWCCHFQNIAITDAKLNWFSSPNARVIWLLDLTCSPITPFSISIIYRYNFPTEHVFFLWLILPFWSHSAKIVGAIKNIPNFRLYFEAN